MAAPVVGKRAPDFTLPSTSGNNFKLSAHRGRAIALYFYPRDATAGCTLQGEGFRDLHPQIRRAGGEVCGISRDSLESHAKFRAKYRFPFELLSDADEKVCGLYDVIHEKTLYGRKSLGVVRSTFLIDAQGNLRREWRKVRVAGHAEEILEAIRSLD